MRPGSTVEANYTWLDADEQNVAGGAQVREVRRPRNSFNLAAWGEAGRFRWGASLAYVGKRRDTDFDLFPAATVMLDDYVLASANLGYRILPQLEALSRGRRMASTPIIRTWSATTRRDGRSMRVFASLLAISLALAAAAAEAAPRRVASLNLCTDELVLLLAAPGQIVSVTHLAQQEAETPLWRQARRYPRNDGSLLSVVAAAARSGRHDGRRRPRPARASPRGSASPRSICPSRRASTTSPRASRRRGRRARPAARRARR